MTTLPEIYVGLDYHRDSIRVCGGQECFDPIYDRRRVFRHVRRRFACSQ